MRNNTILYYTILYKIHMFLILHEGQPPKGVSKDLAPTIETSVANASVGTAVSSPFLLLLATLSVPYT